MMRDPKQQEFRTLPDDALPCVWMSAGLVAYKLCDREYDCEHCPFDAALGRPSQAARAGDKVEPRAARWEFPEDRLYHRCHAWVLALDAAHARCGLDVFAARLLDHVGSVILPVVGSRLQRGRTACWMADETELIPIRCPVSGTVVRVNHDVQQDPGLVACSPYERGWLFEVRCADPSEPGRTLEPAGEQRRRTQFQLDKLQRQVMRPRLERGLGPTLADGGEPVADLRRLLGTARYRRLVLSLLS